MQETQEVKTYEKLRGILINVQRDISNALDTIKRVEELEKKELYKSMPGIEGVFDGVYLIADDGQKLEVPANYAAKSRLVFGDRLKIIEEGENKLFKQIQKPERLRVEGIMSKKEGKWFLLTPSGSFRISDVAAEFNYAEINDKAFGLVPKDNLNAPYAALDKVEKPADFVPPHQQVKSQTRSDGSDKPVKTEAPKVAVTQSRAPEKPSSKPEAPRSAAGKSSRKPSTRQPSRPSSSRDSSGPSREPARRPLPKPTVTEAPINKEFVADITKNTVTLDDDDLR